MTLKIKETLSLAAVIGLFVLGALAAGLVYLRFDMTSTGTFTISQVTRDLLSGLEDEVVMTYFVSKELKTQAPEPQAVEDMLSEYAAASSGKVKLVVVDPSESDRMAEVQQLGLQAYPIQISSNNTFTQVETYSGLTLEYRDQRQVIPFLIRIETMEYDLTSRIRQLQGKEKTSFGILVGNAQYTKDQGLRYISQYLGQAKKVVFLDANTPIDQSLNVVVVLGDQSLTELDAFHLDQYLMKGGRIYFAVDGVDVDVFNQEGTIKASPDTPVKFWLAGRGITLDRTLVLDSTGAIIQGGNQGFSIPVAYPQWVGILGDNVDRVHPVTSRFGGLTLMFASAVSVTPPEGLKAERLLWSTPKSWIMKDQFTKNPDEAKFSFNMGGKETQKSYNLAWALGGKFRSAFADQKPAGIDQEVVANSPETRIIVVGDSDFATDLISQSLTAQANLDFLDNGIDWLAQDEALLSIKSRPQRDRTLRGLKSDPVAATIAWWSLLAVNIVLIPAGVVAYGLIRSARRRAKEKGVKS